MPPAALLCCCGLLALAPPCPAEPAAPWRLGEALGLPEWLEFGGEHRLRYESLDGQFRAGGRGGDQALAFRTLLRAQASHGPWRVGAELQDARLALWDAGTPLDTTQVNALELLQAYAAWRGEGALGAGSTTELLLGRQTLDLGQRRLVARNAFRNTINSFSGGRLHWQGAGGEQLHAFFFLPLARLPDTREGLEEARAVLDEASWAQRFWGLHGRSGELGTAGRLEVYYYDLNEADEEARQTRDRRLHTLGGRLARTPAAGAFDHDLEAALQWGATRASASPADVRDLDQRADFLHVEAGYTFQTAYSPRLSLLYDYASGDEDPTDAQDGRFDTLFGARRFEHGPTGLWGAFARANISSPGYRLQLRLPGRVALMGAHRLYWLAQARDAWTTARVRDPDGSAGRFVGQQFELSARWEAVPGTLTLEGGGAYLAEGEFLGQAPNATGEGDTAYLYGQLTLAF